MTSPLVHQPTVHGNRIVFVSEDDLWSVSTDGGRARRLTSGSGRMEGPRFSRDGRTLAVSATEEGSRDIFTLDSDGGPLERRTWFGGPITACGFDPEGRIVVSTAVREPFSKASVLFAVPPAPDAPVPLQLGIAHGIAWSDSGRRALLRHGGDLAPWQRYRGGRVGRIWVEHDPDGDQEPTFSLLPDFGGNTASLMWIGDRLFFLSDHAADDAESGVGNLWSALPDGSDLRQHTFHTDAPARHAQTDGRRVVYTHAGDLWCVDMPDGTPRKLDVHTHSQRTRTQLRFPNAKKTLQGIALHPEGHSLALTTRGKPFVGGHWEGPMVQVGILQGVHHRLVRFLEDGQHLVWASDADGEDHLEICNLMTGAVRRLDFGLDLGRATSLAVGPGGRLAMTNHRLELFVLDIGGDEQPPHAVRVQKSEGGRLLHPTWSPDGRWLAWTAFVDAWGRSQIVLAEVSGTGADTLIQSVTALTRGRYRDRLPDFDPLGRYLYFLSDREFDPISDGTRFSYAFPRGSRPYLFTLQADQPHPFRPQPRDLGKQRPKKPPKELTVHLDGIQRRIVRFPISDSRYTNIAGLPSGRVLVSRSAMVSATKRRWNTGGPPSADDQLLLWDFDDYELIPILSKITGFTLDHPRKTAAVRVGNAVRVIPADPDKGKRGEIKKGGRSPSRKTFWIDTNRIRLEVDPTAEWTQMIDEAWRLMRDHFWDPGMAGVDWDATRDRYRALAERASVRSEVSDLLWCMNGELGTSHAYEMGGEYRSQAIRRIGRLGVDTRWDGEAWEVTAIHPGDLGHPSRSAPLCAPPANARVGTRIHAVNGVPVSQHPPLAAQLVGHSNQSVLIAISHPGGDPYPVEVRPLVDDRTARYRTWVEANRAAVREATDGRAGYVHIPDMGPAGYADFHRDFLSECALDALVVDVRFNRGGHVSQLLLGQLMQRRLGYSRSRWFTPSPYPAYSVLGPMVALTNELAGSDGDIFSYHWKALQLGPLVGTRTWGGVVGISPRNRLVDGTIVTQPEFATWVEGGPGYGVENRGVDPDHEVHVAPHDVRQGRDPQLEFALTLLSERLEREDPKRPPLTRPSETPDEG